MDAEKVTAPGLARRKAQGELVAERIVMVTAYDATFAALADEAGVDVILVGDSLGMVVQGVANTLPVTLDEAVYHTRLAARGASRALVVGDLPFGSYQVSPQQGVESSIRLIKEGGAAAVKLEGGVPMADTIEAITAVDIPVMAHIGLTPQSFHRMGGHRVQGRTSGSHAGGRDRLVADAKAVEAAGAFSVVLEGIPRSLAAEITANLSIPTIGIGAGPECDGQVLVLHDVLGLTPNLYKFAKAYADLRSEVIVALGAYAQDVRDGTFPDDAHSFH
ncbi:MAG TPA: 3-methyl-2-oxobutanoate hydroxymethyltransferase [Acidimicrobiales bacterium]|nr:3-methyl-2-oxobutanoate hydroxymethyltransferase [Acidimicrobiales bacterium]